MHFAPKGSQIVRLLSSDCLELLPSVRECRALGMLSPDLSTLRVSVTQVMLRKVCEVSHELFLILSGCVCKWVPSTLKEVVETLIQDVSWQSGKSPVSSLTVQWSFRDGLALSGVSRFPTQMPSQGLLVYSFLALRLTRTRSLTRTTTTTIT